MLGKLTHPPRAQLNHGMGPKGVWMGFIFPRTPCTVFINKCQRCIRVTAANGWPFWLAINRTSIILADIRAMIKIDIPLLVCLGKHTLDNLWKSGVRLFFWGIGNKNTGKLTGKTIPCLSPFLQLCITIFWWGKATTYATLMACKSILIRLN